MKKFIGYLLGLSFCLFACTPVKPGVTREAAGVGAGPAPDVVFGRSCTPAEAQAFLAEAPGDPAAAFRGAACWAYRAEQEKKGTADRLEAAKKGRQLAVSTVEAWPKNGLAHYLLGYLTGLVAEETPLRGLELVPTIEREAQLAATLQPEVDHGGPDRMLGELYLRAPGFPVSIGDPALAVDHFRQAVRIAPGHTANRLGLIEALLAEDETSAACQELYELFRRGRPEGDADWLKALDLQQRLCGKVMDR